MLTSVTKLYITENTEGMKASEMCTLTVREVQYLIYSLLKSVKKKRKVEIALIKEKVSSK